MTPQRRALVVTFDQFPASILGCYGNEWIETPHLDRLAAMGIVADACYAAVVSDHQPAAQARAFPTSSLACAAGWLIRDTASELDFAAKFDQTIDIDGERGPNAKPERIPFAEMVCRAKTIWTEDRPQLLWLHARGLPVPAEPPAGFAELYQDEFEDRGANFAALPETEKAVHPLVTAGLASLLDHWLGDLCSMVSSEPDTLIVVTAAQGAVWQPLPNSFGELDELRSQAVHVPWIVSHAGVAAGRIAAPMSTTHLGPLLAAWFEGAEKLLPPSSEPVITRGSQQRIRIATGEWAAIFPNDADSEIAKPLLFAKPEDYWEVNNLAEVSPGVVDELRPS
jgi:hypothetical protein